MDLIIQFIYEKNTYFLQYHLCVQKTVILADSSDPFTLPTPPSSLDVTPYDFLSPKEYIKYILYESNTIPLSITIMNGKDYREKSSIIGGINYNKICN